MALTEGTLRDRLAKEASHVPVPPLPAALQQETLAARRWRRTPWLVPALVAASVAVVAAVSVSVGGVGGARDTDVADSPNTVPGTEDPWEEDPGAGVETSTDLEADMATSPGVPYVLPTRLPDAVAWAGSGPFLGTLDAVTVRSLTFRTLEDPGSMTLCSAAEESAARSCPGLVPGATVVSRKVGDVEVRISLEGAAVSSEDFWESIPLSMDTRQDWLPADR